MPGGSAIVNANGWDASVGLDDEDSARPSTSTGRRRCGWSSTCRNLDRSRWVNQTGNSGHAFNDHYNDQTDAWAKNELYDWPFSEKAVRDAGGDELTLVPGDDATDPGRTSELGDPVDGQRAVDGPVVRLARQPSSSTPTGGRRRPAARRCAARPGRSTPCPGRSGCRPVDAVGRQRRPPGAVAIASLAERHRRLSRALPPVQVPVRRASPAP